MIPLQFRIGKQLLRHSYYTPCLNNINMFYLEFTIYVIGVDQSADALFFKSDAVWAA